METTLPAPRQRWLALASVCLGTFISVVNGSIVNVALPSMANFFQTSLVVIQWVMLIFLLTVSTFLPVVGRLADLHGRKNLYTGGFLILMLGSLVCALSRHLPLLFLGRVIQGLGAAMPMANGMAIATTIFPYQERGRALGLIGTMVAMGALVGPSLSGLLVNYGGWPAAFWVNLPLGLIASLTAWQLLPPDRPPSPAEEKPFDWLGMLSLTVSLISLLLLLSAHLGAFNYLLLPVSLASGAWFIYTEHQAPSPLVDLHLFRRRPFTLALLAAFLAFMAIAANIFLLPFYLQEIRHFTPLITGLLMTPYPLAMALIAPLSGRLSDRYGSLWLTTGGLVLNALGLTSLALLDSTASPASIGWRLTLLGLGMGLFQSPNNSSVMGSVPRDQLSLANAINSLVRNLGNMAGTALWAAIINAATLSGLQPPEAAFLKGWEIAFYLAALLCLVGALLSSRRNLSP